MIHLETSINTTVTSKKFMFISSAADLKNKTIFHTDMNLRSI